MAITINIYYSGENGSAVQFAKEMTERGIVAEIRSRKNNLRYQYFQPLDDPETVLLIDSWTDQAAIDEHHQSPLMQDIMDLREKYGLKVSAERYVSDNNGIPERDQDYLN